MSLQSSQGTCMSTPAIWLALAAAKCKAIQLSIERRSFERKLETIVRAASAHHSCGRPPGTAQFKLLRKCSDELCANFAQRWDISPELLEAQIPAITKLKSLADPPPMPGPTVLRVPTPLKAGLPRGNGFPSPGQSDSAVSFQRSASSLPVSSALSVPEGSCRLHP